MPELLSAVQQLDAAIVVNGSFVGGGRRLSEAGEAADVMDWRVGELSGVQPVGGASPLVSPSLLSSGSGVYVEAVSLRAGELGRLLLSDLTNGSAGGGASWVDELTVDAALLYPFADAGGPSLAVRLALEELPGLSVVRSVGLSCLSLIHI